MWISKFEKQLVLKASENIGFIHVQVSMFYHYLQFRLVPRNEHQCTRILLHQQMQPSWRRCLMALRSPLPARSLFFFDFGAWCCWCDAAFFCVAGWFCLGGLNPVVGDNYGIVYGGGFRDTQESGEFDIPKRTCTMLMHLYHLSICVMIIFFVFVYWAPSRLCHKSQGCSKLLTLRVKLSQCPRSFL